MIGLTPRTGPGCSASRAPSAASTPTRRPRPTSAARSATTPRLGGGAGPPGRDRAPDDRDLVAAGVRLPRPRRAPDLRRAARLMLDQDEPTFANWDQDETAVAERYDLQDPAVAAASWSRPRRRSQRRTTRCRAPEATWARRGLRDNGSEFTVDSLAATTCTTCCTTATTSAPSLPGRPRRPTTVTSRRSARPCAAQRRGARRGGLVRRGGRAGGAVLEIGSGGGRDALAAGGAWGDGPAHRRLDGVRRAAAQQGHVADVLDPLSDELAGPMTGSGRAPPAPRGRPDLPTVLGRLAEATRRGRSARRVPEGGRRRGVVGRTGTSRPRDGSSTGVAGRCTTSSRGRLAGRAAAPRSATTDSPGSPSARCVTGVDGVCSNTL